MKTFKDLLREDSERWLGTSDHMHSKNLDFSITHKNPKISEDEDDALTDYTGLGSHHINTYHRMDKKPFKFLKKSIEEKSNHIDNAISRHTTEYPMHVWRGLSYTPIEKLGLKSGDEFHDKGYVSTSLDPHTAKSFTAHKEVFHIKIPKGSKALHLQSVGAGVMGEHEVLLPRNSKFKYEGSSHEGTHTVHHVTHIPEGHEE